jgi:hypothetical protein
MPESTVNIDGVDEEQPGLAAVMTIPATTNVAVTRREARMNPRRAAEKHRTQVSPL